MTSGDAAERLFAAVRAAALPPAVVTAWNAPAGEPEAGQLWRAAWQGTAEIVLIVGLGEDSVTVVPVTLDEGFDDEHSVRLPVEASSVGSPLTVWRGQQLEIPVFVLDRLVGRADDGWEALGERGRPIVDPVDPRGEFRARLSDALDALAAASWVPSGTGTLGTLLRDAGVKAVQVAEILGSTPQEALALLRNELPITPEQAAALAELAGTGEAELLEANPAPPVDLVARLNRPRRRAQVQALAARGGTDELTARRAAVFENCRFAARQTGGAQGGAAWDERLDQYFAAKLDG